MKITAEKQADGSYRLSNGGRIAEEKYTLTPHGNSMAGRWAYRDANGDLLDYSRSINDLAEHNEIELYPRHRMVKS